MEAMSVRAIIRNISFTHNNSLMKLGEQKER